MRNFLIFLFFVTFSSFAQDTIPATKSVVALDKMNVVYRGVSNPISIAVNNAKSYVISGNGVSKNEDGSYVLRPGSGNETKVFVEIENFDGSKVVEEHVFRIKGLPSGFTTVNSLGCYKNCVVELSNNELLDAVISYEIPDFVFDFEIIVTGFSISFIDINNNKLERIIEVSGNRITNNIIKEISDFKQVSYLKIDNLQIQVVDLDLYICKISPLKILIVK
ncbi:MAG: hypothetical protein ACH34V_09670 [Flavobacterium sp.]|uniref:hypothetical protein n=1 Tax=Flavobacterium sp. TaxID=239 RepID=UPI0037B5FECE